eukprot:m.239998 g.239998  ORF g.239998 m.239998 type:complete len:173 (+) comp18985_c1_seq2:1829-2347(+)
MDCVSRQRHPHDLIVCVILVWKLWQRLHRCDCAAQVSDAIQSAQCTTDHRLHFYENRTLLMLAAWRGRLRCVTALVMSFHADINARDNLGFSPLMFAAWAGQSRVVSFLVSCGADTAFAGRPPMTSSCGGRGPFTALVWAQRKGFQFIENILFENQPGSATLPPSPPAPGPT